MKTKEEFLKDYNISEESFDRADISWDILCSIYDDYTNVRLHDLEDIRQSFMNDYLSAPGGCYKIRSFSSRCKDGEHLIAKIIRRRIKNYAKYRDLNKDNYMKFITDVIGIRGLLLYREDWVSFHEYLLEKIENKEYQYIEDCIRDFDEDIEHTYLAEPPKVHIRLGDYDDIYHDIISPDHIESNKHYRAIHYIVKYRGVYLEIQIKTLFEEGWGEVDHNILYPNKTGDTMLEEFSELLNRVSGLGDEMASFFYRIQDMEKGGFIDKKQYVEMLQSPSVIAQAEQTVCKTVGAMINRVIEE